MAKAYLAKIENPKLAIDGHGSMRSSSLSRYSLRTGFLNAEIIVQLNAHIPIVSEKISIMSPIKKPMVRTQF
ncbi:MAG: hypothetical protein K2H50_03635 [Paramuribaculum sp.]|nr:hypothetical protein [Paramuribaculum sp.]